MKPSKSRHLTFMIMPDTSALEVRRYRVPRRVIHLAASLSVVFVDAAFVATWLNVSMWSVRHENEVLRTEKFELQDRLSHVDDRMREIDQVSQRLQKLDAQLRAMTLVSDPDRDLAIGPVGRGGAGLGAALGEGGRELRTALVGTERFGLLGMVEARLGLAEDEFEATVGSAEALSVFLRGQQEALSSTPSRKPTRGYVSSEYGMRVDPFTGLPQKHGGIDFSGNVGSKVSATGDGVIIIAGPRGAYGNTVQVSHGSGLVTRYAHLSEILVRVGEKVQRGTIIGAVGNTGRSTGPHLHYEVRLNGIAQNPRRYLLE